MAAIDFLHYFVEELVQRLFVSSAFPRPATLPENTPVMPFIITEEDFGLTVVDHLTELLVSQVFDVLGKRFPSGESVKSDQKSHDVSIQEDLPELTFREKLKMMKSNVLKKVISPPYKCATYSLCLFIEIKSVLSFVCSLRILSDPRRRARTRMMMRKQQRRTQTEIQQLQNPKRRSPFQGSRFPFP